MAQEDEEVYIICKKKCLDQKSNLWIPCWRQGDSIIVGWQSVSVVKPSHSRWRGLMGLDCFEDLCFKFSIKIKSEFSLTGLEQWTELQFLNDKIDQNTNFVKLPRAKFVFCIKKKKCENSNYGRERCRGKTLLTMPSNVNFPAHNLNFHWRWWDYLFKSCLLQSPNLSFHRQSYWKCL